MPYVIITIAVIDQLDMVHGIREAQRRKKDDILDARPVAHCPQYGMAACYRRDEDSRHPGRAAPVPEGVAPWLRHSCAIEKRATQYGVQVDGAFADGDDCDLCQRRGRGATEHRGQNVGAIRVMGHRENCHSMLKFFVLDVSLVGGVAVSSGPAPDSAFAPSFLGRPFGQLP